MLYGGGGGSNAGLAYGCGRCGVAAVADGFRIGSSSQMFQVRRTSLAIYAALGSESRMYCMMI